MTVTHKNWAGNVTYSTKVIHVPASLEMVQEQVRNSHKIKALGSRHSFNKIGDTDAELISLENFRGIVSLDTDKQTVTVEGGIRYGDLCERLHEQGFALHNLASLPHISVIGACSTATHGSGVNNGNLATAVSAIEFIQADGELVTLSRESDGEAFLGAVVGLGGLGVVTKITLDVVPAFDMRQDVYIDLPFAQLEAHFDAIMSSAYSVSLFTDWTGDVINQVWIKSRVEGDSVFNPKPEFYGATQATRKMHPLPDSDPEPSTEQMGVTGAWYDRLPHFRMAFKPSRGDELQTEYFVAHKDGYQALLALNAIREQIAPVLLVCEVRTIARDDLWMSPCYQAERVAFHFTWKPDEGALQRLLPVLEAQLAPFNPTPHWGKVFTLSPEVVQSRYTRLGDFRDLLSVYDPDGKFRNPFLGTYVFE